MKNIHLVKITINHSTVRVQLASEKSAQQFAFWCLKQGYQVRYKRLSEPYRLSENEIEAGIKLLKRWKEST